MSKVVNILVEGPTETEFIKSSLRPYLQSQGIIDIRPIGIETSPGHKGGDVRYNDRYKVHISKLLRGSEDMIVTSLIDYYRLRNDFPKFNEAKSILGAVNKVQFLEDACAEDINDSRFIPYIQLHEFEGLLFTKIDGFEYIPELNSSRKKAIEQIIREHPNPELINDGIHTAPSMRLKSILPDYDKVLHGNFVALENQFDTILEKCPRFRSWIELIIQKAS